MAVERRDNERLKVTMDQVQARCQVALDASCRTSWLALEDTASSFQADLQRTPAPPCLEQSSRLQQLALAEFQTASQEFVQALDAGDNAGMVAALDGSFTNATTDVDQATALTESARC